ncbi:hypothetical protein [Tenacibaculum retecalamus]|uniref:hypothetical protein n=1 Tax=Tenacibaculum retecalamus TaxID=3018315 RepID=UPI0023D91EC4|nr:hypothetical protein [Tenacibaculum retecalamus]WBX70870.1 hypothetical protein PG912_11670 [Tenacibaculum retecalamus]
MLESVKQEIERIESYKKEEGDNLFNSKYTKNREAIEVKLKIFFFDKSGRIPLKSIKIKPNKYTITYKVSPKFHFEEDTITHYLYSNYTIEEDYVDLGWCEKKEIKRKLILEAINKKNQIYSNPHTS